MAFNRRVYKDTVKEFVTYQDLNRIEEGIEDADKNKLDKSGLSLNGTPTNVNFIRNEDGKVSQINANGQVFNLAGEKGAKGNPGTASVAIDDDVINEVQTWTSKKISDTMGNYAVKQETNEKIMDLNEKIIETNSQLEGNTQKIEDIAVSIRDFPKITPEANDTGRIQRAIDSYSRIFLPDATYQVSQLVMKTNTHLIGQSIKGVIIKGIDATVKSVIYSDLSANNYSIENMIVDAPNNIQGILFDNTGTLSAQDLHPEVRNVIILNGYNGLSVKSGVRGGLYRNVRPGGCKNHGFAIETTDSIFDSCISAGCGYNGFHVINSNNTFVNCKAFCCGESKLYGAGFKLQGSFNRIVNCEFQQNRFENLYLQNANSNIITGTILDGCGWGSTTYFPSLTYADGGSGAQVPISSLRSYNSKKNIIDVTIINGRLDSKGKTAFYCQYADGDSENDIKFTVNDTTTDGFFTDYMMNYPNAYFNTNKVTINGRQKINKVFTIPKVVGTNATVTSGGYIERDGIVYVDVIVTVNSSLAYVAELLSGFPIPIVDSAMQIYFTDFKRCLINTTGKLLVGGTVTSGDVYRICGCYIKA